MTSDTKNSKLPLATMKSTPLKTSAPNNAMYSLFNTSLNIHSLLTRKQCSTEDESQQFWRRASFPNNVCSNCQMKCAVNLFITRPCGHSVCQNCTSSLEIPMSIYAPCSICVSLQESSLSSTSPSIFSSPATNYFLHHHQQQQLQHLKVQQQDNSLHYFNKSLSSFSSYSSTSSLLNQLLEESKEVEEVEKEGYYCAKISNIPWDVSQNDIRTMFINPNVPELSVHVQSIHIMMDRMTGKTLSDCFVEFKTENDLKRAIEIGNQKHIKGRTVNVFPYKYEDMLKWIFPKWSGHFVNNNAIPTKQSNNPFITREEINSLLVICKNYKLHFSRKCAERPFENIISIVEKYPWHQPELVSTVHRDRIYELLKLSIDSLKTHLAKSTVHIDSTLLQRMTQAGESCPGFTEKQKLALLYNAAPNQVKEYCDYYPNELLLLDNSTMMVDDGSSMSSSCSTGSTSSTFSLSFAEAAASATNSSSV